MSKKKKKNNKTSQNNKSRQNQAVKPTHTISSEKSITATAATEKKQAPAVQKASAPATPVSSPAAASNDKHPIMHPGVSYAYILILFALLVAVFLLKLKADNDLKEANSLNEQLTTAVLTASENIAKLSTENTEQKKQLEALSMALNARTEMAETQKKEEEESSVPELYPVKGDALVVTPTGTADGANTHEEDNLLRFSMGEGSYAIAAGNGTIEIMSDGGDGLINIVIDHGNGYKTSYTGEGISLKEAGAEIKRGDAIMIFTVDGSELVYSVSLDGKNIDPVSVMNIDG